MHCLVFTDVEYMISRPGWNLGEALNRTGPVDRWSEFLGIWTRGYHARQDFSVQVFIVKTYVYVTRFDVDTIV